MLLSVRFQRVRLRERLLTNVAHERSLARVRALVTYDVTLMMKTATANATHVRAFVRVRPAVSFQVELFEEALPAMQTHVIALLQMIPFHVFL